jgi:hypothetical protein
MSKWAHETYIAVLRMIVMFSLTSKTSAPKFFSRNVPKTNLLGTPALSFSATNLNVWL